MTSHDHLAASAAGIDFDHTSFAVQDAMTWARRLRRDLGATPIAGETLPEFRYLLLYVGTARRGGRIELLEPNGPGFLSRFLDKHGEGAHHVTFTVPDLRDTVERVRSIGATVVGESYGHAPWREAFLLPEAAHGIVVQLAQSDRAYPPPQRLLSTRDRDTTAFPSTRGATDPTWWTELWDTSAGPASELGPTHLMSTDPAYTRRLFVSVLQAGLTEHDDALEFTWPSGSLLVRTAESPGISGVGLGTGPARNLTIGSVRPGTDDPAAQRDLT